MLTEPRWPVCAMRVADWKAETDAGIRELREPETVAQEGQLWSYSPPLITDATSRTALSKLCPVRRVARNPPIDGCDHPGSDLRIAQ